MAHGDSDSAERLERREEERFPVLGELEGEVRVFQPMVTTELGRGGVQIETSFPFHLDSIHELRLALDQPIVVKGRVTHCSIIDVDQEFVRYRSGVEFIDMPARLRQVIET